MTANPNCYFGDHDWSTNGYCHCGAFNPGWLSYQAFEKAQREGRACQDHYHRTAEAHAACRKPVRYPEGEEA